MDENVKKPIDFDDIENKPEIEKKQYRTKKKAGDTDKVPEYLMVPTSDNYQAALSFKENGVDAVVPIKQDIKIRYDQNTGLFYYDGIEIDFLDLEQVREHDLSKTDLWPLRVMYSIIGESLTDAFNEGTLDRQVIGHTVKIYVPDLIDALNGKRNLDAARTQNMLNTLMSYQHVIGVIKEFENGRVYTSRYPMLVWMGANSKDNTIMFASPYLNMLVYNIMKDAARIDKRGNTLRKRNGNLLFEAHNSYLVKPSIVRERNKRAAEIVRIVCVLIEQAGDFGTAHISARTIIERHAELAQALDETDDSSNKNRMLKKTFLKAWELLHTQTKLEEVYKDIKFPTTYPTIASLDMVFEFPHKGKRKSFSEKPGD